MSTDLDLRKLRYFLTLAEELNYGRAARALHIAQPVLTRQIRALEEELKASLFLRDRRGVELTPAGQSLRVDAGPLLAAAEAARRRVDVAACGTSILTIGFMPGLIVTEAVTTFEAEQPQVRVEVIRTSWDDQVAVLHDGRADVSYIRLPVDEQGIDLIEIGTEPRVAVVAASHRLAGRGSIVIRDLADDPLLQNPDAVPEWRDLRSGSARLRPPDLPVDYPAVEEKLHHVARGHGVAVLPVSVAGFYDRPDVTTLTVEDIGPSRVALAWKATRRSPVVARFVQIAADVGSPAVSSATP